MKKELLVKKLMDTTITFESVKEILVSELDNRVEVIGELENLKLYDVSYYIGEKLNQIEDLSQSEYRDIYSHIFRSQSNPLALPTYEFLLHLLWLV